MTVALLVFWCSCDQFVTYVDIPIEPMTSVGPDEVLAVLVAFISSGGLAPAGLCWVNCNINVKQIK